MENLPFNKHKMKSFREEVSPFLELITADIHLESVWLSVMSMLEDIAAENILSNVTDKTPADSLRDILVHIKDEQRHARVLETLRPVKVYPDLKYYEIEEEFKNIGREFIMSFFNSDQLRNANHRYAAYIHGAQTIERFPFRIYTLYLSLTKLESVKAELPKIIEDESEHIALGKKMYEKLSPEERMPLSDLYRLEETVCLMMLKRMHIVLKEKLNLSKSVEHSVVALKSIENKKFEIAFNYALYVAERFFSDERAEFLQVGMTLSRLELRNDSAYKQMEKALVFFVTKYIHNAIESGVSKETIQERFNSHYNEMIFKTNTMALHYAYHCILEIQDANILTSEKPVEENLWNELNATVIKELENDNSISLSWA
jgi:hypothetical protein